MNDVLTQPIANEHPNRPRSAATDAEQLTSAQRVLHQRTHVMDEGREVHRSRLLFEEQYMQRDTTHDKGRLSRMRERSKRVCLSDDSIGDGYRVYMFVQYKVYDSQGNIDVGVAQILQLAKTSGKSMHPRLSIARADAHVGYAILMPYSHGNDSFYGIDRKKFAAGWVSLRSVGCEVEMCKVQPGIYQFVRLSEQHGSQRLRPLHMGNVNFSQHLRVHPNKDVARMLNRELSDELRARNLPISGVKAALVERLRTAYLLDIEEAVRSNQQVGQTSDRVASLHDRRPVLLQPALQQQQLLTSPVAVWLPVQYAPLSAPGYYGNAWSFQR